MKTETKHTMTSKNENLICLTGKTYEDRAFSGCVVNGVWVDANDCSTAILEQAQHTLASPEVTDAPVEVVQNDDGTDFYYDLVP